MNDQPTERPTQRDDASPLPFLVAVFSKQTIITQLNTNIKPVQLPLDTGRQRSASLGMERLKCGGTEKTT